MKSQLFTRSNHGFTLIETLIVILIIGILSAIAAPSWLAFVDATRLNAAQDEVYRAMREAQGKAKQEKRTWQASFRENSGVVQWAVHPTGTTAYWNSLEPQVRIDSETSLYSSSGVWRIQFNYKGNANGQLGQITLNSRNGGRIKRCVIVSTLLGAIRTAKEQPTPNTDGKYCY